MCTGALTCSAGACTDCVDSDGDGLSDLIEGAPSRNSDSDATPDYMDSDSDNDGFSDRVEAARGYPGFSTGSPALMCGAAADNCDSAMDGRPNYIDLDSDNDGVPDADERTRNTNPCARDTDGDGLTDLVEQIARTDPTMSSSRLPATSLATELPYRTGGVGPVDNQEFSFVLRSEARGRDVRDRQHGLDADDHHAAPDRRRRDHRRRHDPARRPRRTCASASRTTGTSARGTAPPTPSTCASGSTATAR
jgi:hypothetical protein